MATWARSKVWIAGDLLTAGDLNGEINLLGAVNTYDWNWSGVQMFNSGTARFKGPGAGIGTLRNGTTASNRTHDLPDIGVDAKLVGVPTGTSNPTRGQVAGRRDSNLGFNHLGMHLFHQWGWMSFNSSFAYTPSGVFTTGTNTANTSALTTSAEGPSWEQNTSTVNGNDAGHVTSNLSFTLNSKPYLVVKFRMKDTAVKRFFLGFTGSTTLATSMDTVRPNTDHIGLSFSTDAPDTNWKISCDANGGASPTIADTGVAASTSTLYFIMNGTNGTSWQLELLSSSLTSLYSGTISADIPAASTALAFIIGTTTLEAVAKGHGLSLAHLSILGAI